MWVNHHYQLFKGNVLSCLAWKRHRTATKVPFNVPRMLYWVSVFHWMGLRRAAFELKRRLKKGQKNPQMKSHLPVHRAHLHGACVEGMCYESLVGSFIDSSGGFFCLFFSEKKKFTRRRIHPYKVRSICGVKFLLKMLASSKALTTERVIRIFSIPEC